MTRQFRCHDCGAANPQLIEQADLALLTDEILEGDGPVPTKWVCRHRGACEARVMLAAGASTEDAVAHIRQRGTGECVNWDDHASCTDSQGGASEARKLARAHGWTRRNGEDLCPDCRARDDERKKAIRRAKS